MPFFSIIIPTYNRAHMLPEAIDSVLAQTFDGWELIVVDDGSKDSTKELVGKYIAQDPRVKYIYQENAERSAARNNGIKNSKGNYICFLDSDDYFKPERLELLNQSIEQEQFPIAFFYTDSANEINGKIELVKKTTPNQFENIYDFAIQSTIHSQQVCIHKDILKTNKYNINIHIAEDTELWVRIFHAQFPCIYLENQATIVIKVHDDRSINPYKHNTYLKWMEVLDFMIKKYHYPFSKSMINAVRTGCSFNVAKFYFFNDKKWKSISYIIKSIWFKPFAKNTKYKINVMLNILVNPKKAKKLFIA